MIAYKDTSGNSGVLSYEAGKDYIKVIFKGEDSIYVYNYIKPGRQHVEAMKKLAVAGAKLSTYISVNVRANYYDKIQR